MCKEVNCVYSNHKGLHAMYAFGTETISVEWKDDGSYRIDGVWHDRNVWEFA
jgi:hypothetical protein